MTRLQKKCFLFSVGMHGLLLIILVGSSAFRAKPATKDMQLVMTMIPSKILDQSGVGGGSPEPAAAPKPPQPAPPAPAALQIPQPVAQPKHVEPVERPSKPEEVEKEPAAKPLASTEPSTKPTKKPHEVVPEYTLASSVPHKKTKTKASETATSESESRAEAKRVQQQIAAALEGLATGVKTSGAAGTVVDMPGQGGGEAFIGYETFIFNAYYRAWTPPDSIADRQAGAGVKIVVARDGTVVSSEIIDRSGKPVLDKSVERALRLVTKLPPFPESAHDEQRTFLLRFNLEAKESSG